jgi:hypothetical protein
MSTVQYSTADTPPDAASGRPEAALPSGGGVKLVKHGQRPNQFGGALDGSPLEAPPICGPLGTLACLRVRGQPRQLPSSRVELITTFSPPPPLHAGGGRRHCAPHCLGPPAGNAASGPC